MDNLHAQLAAKPAPPPQMTRTGSDFLYIFHAMATPCEVRLESEDAALAQAVADAVETEARRIERKFSRYKSDSVVGRINASGGQEILVDAETAHLLDFAAKLF